MLLEERVVRTVTEREAAQLARDLYGLETVARALPGEYDENFHLIATIPRSGDSTRAIVPPAGLVLKVMHPARDRSLIDLQCSVLQHLAKQAPQLTLPRVWPTRSGQTFTAISGSDGSQRLVWMLTYVAGTVLAKANPHSSELLHSLGRFLAEMDAALASFSHPAARRELKWDLARASWIRKHIHHIADGSQRALIEKFLGLYEAEVLPVIPELRHSVVYGDANDHNVLVSEPWPLPRQMVSVVDFGDVHETFTVSDVAIAVAYAMFGKKEPLAAAASVVAGYHSAFPLMETELRVLFPLMAMRLAVSVTNAVLRKAIKPKDEYVTISEAPAWETLRRLATIHPRFAHYVLREACGLRAVPHCGQVEYWLACDACNSAGVFDVDLRKAPSLVFDFSVGSTFLGADPAATDLARQTGKILAGMQRVGAAVGIGRYNEARAVYSSPLFGSSENPTDERRTIHLGIDLLVEAGSAVRAPLDGVVHALANNTARQDYGPVVILRHRFVDSPEVEAQHAAPLQGGCSHGEFFTLYGHLSTDSLTHLRVGQKISRGEKFGEVGDIHENGGWTPHLHFQVILDLLDYGTDFPGVAFASQRGVWTNLSPDPNPLLGIPAERFTKEKVTVSETLASRKSLLGKNLSVSYRQPLKIVRGWMQYLYDDTGRAYLDVYNNVPLVGHSHPRVVRATQEQLALLNTNTRYLHDSVVRYAERLTQLLPEPLGVCYFLNSGSEANELALRLARARTRREDVIVLDHAYHGHTSTLVDISPYKFSGPGGKGRKSWVHVAPVPDDYRGAYRRGDPHAGAKYAAHVGEIADRLREEGRGFAAFIAETLPSVAGQIVFPPQYLAEVYRRVRAAGGVCIADEVQVGFGRLGTHFWGFSSQNVVPDIVVLGKPMGNGFPLAAVITTREIAASFDNGMEFFSTFGGNPVACAAGLAVLDVLRDENLQERARLVGDYWMAGLKKLQESFALIGDVRGSGLFLGIDLVRDPATREPATQQADYIVNRLRECGVLTGADGPHHNVLKLRPPLIFSEADADLFLDTLKRVLQEDAARP